MEDVPRYCCVGPGQWFRVVAGGDGGVWIDPRRRELAEIWDGVDDPAHDCAEPQWLAWEDLDVPLPHHGPRCWGYALTYPEHRDETLRQPAFRFLKEGSVMTHREPLPFREFLDFELEIGVLMHQDSRERFGYFIANDLTDRGIQVQSYDPANPAPGFTMAKSFAGSLRAGPLLVLGDASVWPRLSATLWLNHEERQVVRAVDCGFNPTRFHDDLFAGHEGDPWLLVATGTSGGTLFRSPQAREKWFALMAGWFSIRRARKIWLGGLRFLQPGDVLLLRSAVLGSAETRVVGPMGL